MELQEYVCMYVEHPKSDSLFIVEGREWLDDLYYMYKCLHIFKEIKYYLFSLWKTVSMQRLYHIYIIYKEVNSKVSIFN